MNRYELRDSAIAFFDGGWRAEDKEELRAQIDENREYGRIPDEELDYMIGIIAELEAKG